MDNGSVSNGCRVFNKNYPAPVWHRAHTAASMFCRWRCESRVTLFSLRFVLEETRHSVLTQNSIVGFDVEHEKSNGCSKRRLLKLSFQSCESEWAKLIAYQLLKTKIGESFLSEFGVLGTWGLIEGWRRSLRSLTRRQGKDDVLFQGDNAIKPMVKQLVYGHKGLKGSQIK